MRVLFTVALLLINTIAFSQTQSVNIQPYCVDNQNIKAYSYSQNHLSRLALDSFSAQSFFAPILLKLMWETWWLRGIAILAVFILIYVAYTLRIKQIKRQEKLRSSYEIKINDLENNALRSRMNPHFIFNSLNTISSLINKNEILKANQYITKFSKLLRLTFDHSQKRTIPLADELHLADLYIQIERIRFDNKFNYRIDVAKDIDIYSTEISPLIVQPFIENAILDGLLPLSQEGLLQIYLCKKDNMLVCIIEDNGISREQALQNKQLSPDKRKLHDLEVTLERIELFNKEHNVEAPVFITNLLDSHGKPAGTKVEIMLACEESF